MLFYSYLKKKKCVGHSSVLGYDCRFYFKKVSYCIVLFSSKVNRQPFTDNRWFEGGIQIHSKKVFELNWCQCRMVAEGGTNSYDCHTLAYK